MPSQYASTNRQHRKPYVLDAHAHVPDYALGYLFKEVNPRVGLATHLEYEHNTNNEVVAGVRAHWDGLFLFGAPDVQVINVTQDAVWARQAVLPGLGTVTRPTGPDLVRMFGTDGEMPETIEIPQPRLPREDQQDQYLRDIEIDPTLYMPPDVMRDLVLALPPEMKIDVAEMAGRKQSDESDD